MTDRVVIRNTPARLYGVAAEILSDYAKELTTEGVRNGFGITDGRQPWYNWWLYRTKTSVVIVLTNWEGAV